MGFPASAWLCCWLQHSVTGGAEAEAFVSWFPCCTISACCLDWHTWHQHGQRGLQATFFIFCEVTMSFKFQYMDTERWSLIIASDSNMRKYTQTTHPSYRFVCLSLQRLWWSRKWLSYQPTLQPGFRCCTPLHSQAQLPGLAAEDECGYHCTNSTYSPEIRQSCNTPSQGRVFGLQIHQAKGDSLSQELTQTLKALLLIVLSMGKRISKCQRGVGDTNCTYCFL